MILKILIRSTTTKSMTGLDASAVGAIAIPPPKKDASLLYIKMHLKNLTAFLLHPLELEILLSK